jgi:hypothetical protein
VTTQSLNFLRRLKEISRFFDGRDQVHKSLRRLVRHLKKAGIPYAILGGMAVNAHKYERTTKDVDVLLTPGRLGGVPPFVRAPSLPKRPWPRAAVR